MKTEEDLEEAKQSDDTIVVQELEDMYPEHDRRVQGWKLTGFVEGAKVSREKILNGMYPYGKVPTYLYLGWGLGEKYDGATLRKLRKERGVGKRKNK